MARELTSTSDNAIGRGALIWGLVVAASLAATPGAAADLPAPGPPGQDWLELAVGEHEQALFRHHFRANLLAQIQSLVGNKPAEGTKRLLDVMDGALVVRRGRRMWLDLSRVETGQAEELRRLAAINEPKDRLDLMTELREHVATVERGKGKGPMNFTASFNCFACHRVTHEDTSEALRDNGFNYLDQLSQRMKAPWPEQVHLGPEYREPTAYQLTETELRQRDGVFGPYGSLLLSELIYKQKHDRSTTPTAGDTNSCSHTFLCSCRRWL